MSSKVWSSTPGAPPLTLRSRRLTPEHLLGTLCRTEIEPKVGRSLRFPMQRRLQFLNTEWSCQTHRQSLGPNLFFRFLLTEAPSLRRSYPASSVLRASPSSNAARPDSRGLPVDPPRHHRWGFPCCVWSPLPACRRHYPGRTKGNLFARTSPWTSAFPKIQAGRPLHRLFRGLLSVHIVTAYRLAELPSQPSTPEASAASLPPLLLGLLPGGANQFPGGAFTHCGPAPFHGALNYSG